MPILSPSATVDMEISSHEREGPQRALINPQSSSIGLYITLSSSPPSPFSTTTTMFTTTASSPPHPHPRPQQACIRQIPTEQPVTTVDPDFLHPDIVKLAKHDYLLVKPQVPSKEGAQSSRSAA